ncbi:MAG TPA: phosphate acyltransferase PlsX [Phycisphaerae bacterium]|nr:phosphate acyltransferase PlsX [Phycisphaerae bacterium]
MIARIALDAMGGDNAPGAIVRGALEAVAALDDVVVVLVGREDVIRDEIERAGGMRDRIEIVHASQVIEMDETPTDALRQKKDSSLMVMARLAADRQVDAVISAGNTGACAAAAQLRMRPLKCISRPGIAVTLPTFHGPVVLCDVGANIQAKPHHLYEYAVMATLYAEHVVGIKSPRVGLVSIGEESRKGTEVVKLTHDLLIEDPQINFVGNVEGRELFQNRCEVAVSDGFVGNILLKFIEGLSEALFKTISAEFRDEDPAAKERFDGALSRVWARHDYSEYGGAPLLGVDGVCIICHGRSEERAIRNAVRAAAAFLKHKINDAIVARLGDAKVAG